MPANLAASSAKLRAIMNDTVARMREQSSESLLMAYVRKDPSQNARIVGLRAPSIEMDDDGDYVIREQTETKLTPTGPTNCKNCGAPLQQSRCAYCSTNYAIDFSPVKVVRTVQRERSAAEMEAELKAQLQADIEAHRFAMRMHAEQRERKHKFTWRSFFCGALNFFQ